MVPPETDVAVALFWAIAFSGSGSEALRKAAALDEEWLSRLISSVNDNIDIRSD
jgi:hypothetical protein